MGGTEYSADYPYFLEKELRRTFGASFVSVFGAGTCGDINHINVARPERLKTEEIGRGLGALSPNTPLGSFRSTNPRSRWRRRRSNSRCNAIQSKNLSTHAQRSINWARHRSPFLKRCAQVAIIELADFYKAATTRLEVQAFRLGKDVAIVTLPGEVFVEHGLAIKKASPFKTTIVVELANACPAYIPTKKAFGEGSYEIVNSRLAPGGGEALVESAVRLLQKLHREGE